MVFFIGFGNFRNGKGFLLIQGLIPRLFTW